MELPRGFTPSSNDSKEPSKGKPVTFVTRKPDYQMMIGYNPEIKMKDLERFWILSAVEKCNGSISRASKLLGLAKETVYRKVRVYNKETK
jgi:transcriptional regulator of acetoin/glycerol metabolism